MTKDYNITDRHGKRVQRAGILQDGDRLTVKMTMMDGMSSVLARAAADAEAV
jgi:hypothetical protein